MRIGVVISALTVLVCTLAMQGCAGFVVSEGTTSAIDWQPPLDQPMTIRTLGSDGRFSQVSSASIAERLRAVRGGEPLSILALSGGGSFGAFGAGALVGLTRSGQRPEFAVVTGISTGALIAPYAFLGPAWDARLRDVYTGGAADKLLQSRGLGVLFGSSLYSGKPLQQLADAYATDDMIQAVAREAGKGRLLLVATTDVASGEPVVWDMGAIARNGGPQARTLFRDVLVASASVPGMFPPVMIGAEAHVDGSATGPFFVPSEFVRADHPAVYVIVDGPLGEASGAATRLTTRSILSRSIHTGLNHFLLTTLELTAATAQLQGATLHYAAVPAAYPHIDAFDFRAATMRPLFSYADDCAQAGRLWTAFQHTGAAVETPAVETPAAATRRVVPCPADDGFIGRLASR